MIRSVSLLKFSNYTKLLQRCYCSIVPIDLMDPKLKEEKSVTKFYSNVFGISYNKMFTLMPENKHLNDLDRDEVLKILKFLYGLGMKPDDILQNLQVLQNSCLTLKNRTEIYEECGFVNPRSVSTLAKYIIIMNKSIQVLKNNGVISRDLDVGNHLIKIASPSLSINVYTETPLKQCRRLVLNEILKFRLGLTDGEIEKVWNSYVRVKHKSFSSILTVLDILENEVELTRAKIKTNLFLLYADADNIRKFLNNFDTVAGLDIKEVLRRRPKVIMSNAESTEEILGYLRKYEIPETGLLNCLELLTLGPKTVLERLIELKKIQEFNVLVSHPRILRLVHYFNKAKIRLEYFQQIKLKCISLNVLASSSVAFEKYAKDGYDKTKGVDIVLFIAKEFDKPNKEVRDLMTRHYHWCSVPTMRIKSTLEFLRLQSFSLADIYENLHILLYPINRIEEKLSILNAAKESGEIHAELNMDVSQATLVQILSLCLYLVERDCHFTCDGIWEEPTLQNDVQVSHSLEVPKTLNKEYKFGIKPAAHKLSQFSS